MINIETFVFNPFAENTYVVYDSETKEAFVVDPGCSDKREEDELSNFIEHNKISIKYMFNTHGHIDHVLGDLFVKEKFAPVFFYPANEIHFFEIMEQQALKFGINYKKPPKPDRFFDETTELYIGKTKIKFISTPGHSPDEYCIYLPDEDLCFTGDVLFNESIGRTDLWGGDYNTLLNSIKTKLYSLPLKTIILPGHGTKSKIEHEMMYNPFIKVVD
jgi:glyoxylase-like metal-dependent hydrolase (beta-lactamase superfamily II)